MRLSNGSAEPAREVSVSSTGLVSITGLISSGLDSFTGLINSNLLVSSKVLKTALILLVTLCLVPSVSARDYTLEAATTNITIDSSGIVHVEESISYVFDGDYNNVYRKLKVSSGESIRNIEGYCSDEECRFRVEPIPEGYKLIGELPNPTPKQLTFFISYDHYGLVKVHNDSSEFHYKLWGEEWERPLGNLKGSITLPVKNESEIQYWIHPTGYTRDINLQRNTLNLETEKIPSYQWYEIRVVFPRIESPNSSLVQVDDAERLKDILAIESEYQHKSNALKNIYSLTLLIALFVLIFPLFIYYKYGKEPEIAYEAIYEREPPTDSKPAIVNAIMKGNKGTPTIDGFTATVMDLVRLNYISLRTIKPKGKRTSGLSDFESKDIIIRIFKYDRFTGAEKDTLKLEDFEKDVLELLKSRASENKVVSWKKLKEELGNGTDFYKFIKDWNKKVKAHTGFDKLFQSTGNKYMSVSAVPIVIAATAYYLLADQYFPSNEFPLASNLNTLVFFILIFEISMLIISSALEKVFGRWTPEGRLYYKRWDNFKKYLTDFSALKEQPPESIKVWDFYLVYATSLGIAKEVLHNMTLVVPAEQQRDSSYYYIQDSYDQFNSGFGEAYSESNPGGGDGGDGGGGDGGGGGGGGAD